MSWDSLVSIVSGYKLDDQGQGFLPLMMVVLKSPYLGAFWKIARINYWLRCICLSIHVEQLRSHWTDSRELLYLSIFRKSFRKFRFHSNPTRIMGTLHEDLCTFCDSILLNTC